MAGYMAVQIGNAKITTYKLAKSFSKKIIVSASPTAAYR
jgi:hypothetical protein